MNCPEGDYRIAYNIFWENHDCDVAFGYQEMDEGWSYEEERDFTGVDGNLFADPMLIDHDPLLIDCGPEVHMTSPCIDNGDPQYVDLDGTRSDIGVGIALNPDLVLISTRCFGNLFPKPAGDFVSATSYRNT